MWVNIKMHLMVLPNCVYQGRRHGLQVESHSPLRHCFVFSLSHCVLIKVADHDVPVLEQIQKGANTRGGGATGRLLALDVYRSCPGEEGVVLSLQLVIRPAS